MGLFVAGAAMGGWRWEGGKSDATNPLMRTHFRALFSYPYHPSSDSGLVFSRALSVRGKILDRTRA
jgi:hypothetical protein